MPEAFVDLANTRLNWIAKGDEDFVERSAILRNTANSRSKRGA